MLFGLIGEEAGLSQGCWLERGMASSTQAIRPCEELRKTPPNVQVPTVYGVTASPFSAGLTVWQGPCVALQWLSREGACTAAWAQRGRMSSRMRNWTANGLKGHKGDLLPSVTFIITDSTEAWALNSTPILHVSTSPLSWDWTEKVVIVLLLSSGRVVALGWPLPALWEGEGGCAETQTCTQHLLAEVETEPKRPVLGVQSGLFVSSVSSPHSVWGAAWTPF